MKNFLRKFLRDERGLTAVEYAIAGGLVVAGLAVAFTNLGNAALARIQGLVTALG